MKYITSSLQLLQLKSPTEAFYFDHTGMNSCVDSSIAEIK